jgi:hypothetical protein
MCFEDFWERAVRPDKPAISTRTVAQSRPLGCIVWPGDTYDRKLWQEAIEATAEEWRNCYLGLPQTTAEKAVASLAPFLDVLARRTEAAVWERPAA